MRIRIIGVPSAWGTRELGAQRTPGLLREHGLVDWLSRAGHQVDDAGDVDVPPQGEADIWRAPDTKGGLVHVAEVAAMARSVRAAVGAALDDGCLPVVVGGECSVCIGAVPALAARRGPVTVAWLDAHGDMNTPDTSASGLITGMPCAAMLGHGDPRLTAIGDDAPRPEPERTFLIGGRDLDPGDVNNIAEFAIQHLDTESSRASGPEQVAMRVLGVPELAVIPPEARAQIVALDPAAAAAIAAAPRPNVYLHFDVDSLDPEFAPGVHDQVAGGFDPAEVATLAGYLCASGHVGVITVASANLDHDVDHRTMDSVRTVFASIADALAAVGSQHTRPNHRPLTPAC